MAQITDANEIKATLIALGMIANIRDSPSENNKIDDQYIKKK